MSLSFIAPPQAKLGLLIHPSYLPPGHYTVKITKHVSHISSCVCVCVYVTLD